MATPLDLLNEPEFADGRLTEAINLPPMVTGRLAQIGLFRDATIPTTYARIGLREQTLAIIPSRERGGPANKNITGGRSEVIVSVPHYPLDDAIKPTDMQNILAYGTDNQLLTLAGIVNDRLLEMRLKHDLTLAHAEWGAVNGLITDAENFVLLDVYDAFGLTRETFAYGLGTTTTNVAGRNRALKTLIQGHLNGMPSNGVRIFASSGFFDSYVGHENVIEAYRNYAPMTPAVDPARADITDTFYHAGIWIERVDEEFPVRLDDNTFEMRPAIPAGEAIAIPMGTQLFRRYIAPPDTIFDVNRAPAVGSRIFVSTVDLPHGKGRDIHTESNVLPLCLRPQVMIRVTQ